MTTGLFELAILVLIAAVLGFAAKMLRQPLMLAYLGAGVAVSYFGLLQLQDQDVFRIFSDLGIMFLLFLVGLEINYASLKIVGKPALFVGLGQVFLTLGIGYGLAQFLGFGGMASAYIATAITFSSTIIVVKLLSEKKDLNSLYGRLSISILLVQDFIVILLLVILAGLQPGERPNVLAVLMTILKGLGLFALMLWLGRKILPHIFYKISRSDELLFLVTLAWVFLVAALVSRIGFSIEIAGFLAGLALANSSEHFQIANRIRPLRDFFILIFFIILGASVMITDFTSQIWPIIALSLFVIVGKPLIVVIIMSLMRYRKRTSILAGFAVAQISEFSLVLAALGYRLGHLDAAAVSLVTAVGIFTITSSSYLIMHGNQIANLLSRGFALFERRRTLADSSARYEYDKSIILIGAHRTGQNLALSLPKNDLLVIDFDPEVAFDMKQRGYECISGDVMDPEVAEKANFSQAKLVISTSPDFQDNLGILTTLNALARRPKAILRAESEEEAQILYKEGADYVLLPHFTAGQYLGKTISVDPDANILESLKQRDLEVMRHKSSSGQANS